MKFKILSVRYGEHAKPCKNAIPSTYIVERVNDDNKLAKIEYLEWIVEINSIEELMELAFEVSNDLIIHWDERALNRITVKD